LIQCGLIPVVTIELLKDKLSMFWFNINVFDQDKLLKYQCLVDLERVEEEIKILASEGRRFLNNCKNKVAALENKLLELQTSSDPIKESWIVTVKERIIYYTHLDRELVARMAKSSHFEVTIDWDFDS
jgi:hypothetical protein